MEQNNFNGQEQIRKNNAVHQPSHEPEAQQIHANSVDNTSPITQQSTSSYNIHHSNPQYTSPVHNGTSYAHNPSSYENGNTNGNSSLQNGNHTSHNKKSKSYGYFMLTALLVAIVITAIVIGVGWAVFYPRPTTAQQALVPPNPSTTITQNDTHAIDDTDTDAGSKDVVIIYGGNNNISDTTTKKSDTTAKKSTSQTNRNDTAPKSSPSPPPVQKTVEAPPAPVVTKTTTVTSKKVSPPSPPPTTPVPSTPSEYTTKYWIQVFSTNNRDKAVQIKKTLDEQGIKSTVITKTINSKIYYRLRIGPYYNKSEGHKFLEWVKRNEKYKDAYISVDRS